MSFDAGQVHATLGGYYNPAAFKAFDRDMLRSGRNMELFESRVARSATRTSQSHNRMARTIGYGTAGALTLLGAAAVKSVQAFEGYNRQMQTAQAVSKASAREMKALDAATKKIGVTTKYSATEAAGASVELIKAGMTMTQVIGGGLTAALSLAAAGDLELAEAAKYTSNAMNMFGIQAGKASTISDALATAANATTADVGDFGMALTQGGSAAKMAGLSFKDTMVILEALAKQGIKNSDAGTSMKTSLLQLLSPTAKQAELQKELGLSFVGNNGKMKNAVQISRDLHRATKDMTQAERLATFEKLAGTDGVRTLNALYATGPKTLANYAKGLGLAGEAARVAKAKQEGLSGSLDKSKAAAQTALVIIGEQLAPTVAEAADGFSRFIREAASNGDLEDFGQGLADAAEDVGELARQFYVLGSSAVSALSPATGALRSLSGAMPDGSAVSILGGVAAGFLAFRGASAAAPGVERMAGSINKAVAAGRGANMAQNIATSFAAAGMMAQRTDKEFTGLRSKTAGVRAGFASLGGGLAATAAGLGPIGGIALAAGAGFALYSYSQQKAADEAADAASAIRDSGEAAKTAGDQYVEAAGAVLQAEQQKAALQDLVDQRDKARKDGQKQREQQLNNQIKQGRLNLETATKGAKQKVDEAPIVTAQKLSATLREVDTRQKALTSSERELTRARLSNYGPKIVGDLEREVAAKRKLYEASKRQEAQMRAARSLDSLNQQRSLSGRSGIAPGDAQGVVALRNAMKGMPKALQTKILVTGSSRALGQLGELMDGFRGIPSEKRAKAILTGDGSVKQKIAALKALAIRDKRFGIHATDQASRTIAQIQQQRIADKFFSIFGIPAKGAKNAIGARPGQAKRDARGASLVGEEHPNETVYNRRTGEGYITNGPMLVNLSNDDYVIPHDPKYRGRSAALLAMLARDLGIPAYKKGKAGAAKFPIPKKHNRNEKGMAASLEDLQAKYERIKGKKKGKRKGLDQAKRAYLDAKRYADAVSKQEDFIEIAENSMTLAAKRKDSKAYGAANTKRTNALSNLKGWLTEAVKLAPNGSKWQRELQKKLGQIKLSQEDGGPTMGEPDSYLTDAEQTSIDDYEAKASQAALTDTLDDDASALGSLKDIREAIYNRVVGAGAPSTVIKEAADELRQARDNVTNLVQNATPNKQAELDQANERARVAQKDSDAANAALKAFGGPGDIGSGGQNAYGAAGGSTVNVYAQSLTPHDPAHLALVAGAAAAGVNAQGYVPTSRVKTGV